MIVVLGDLNAQTKGWYPLAKTTYKGTRIGAGTIEKPNHIFGECSSCIDIIFACQPNLVVKSGAQSSLHQNCHHQIVFARFNLKVIFPFPYEREVWNFQKANADHIRKAINGFQWKKSFQNMNKYFNEMVHLFDKTVKNILHNFILHEIITCDDRYHPWIDSSLRRLIQD